MKLVWSAALVASAFAGAAHAAIVTVQVTGTVVGVGYLNGFGPLTGDTPFAVTYVFDTATPGAYLDNSASTSQVYGGADYGGGTSPLLSASFTVDRNTLNLSPDEGYYGFQSGSLSINAVQYVYPVQLLVNVTDPALPTSMYTSFSLDVSASAYHQGNFFRAWSDGAPTKLNVQTLDVDVSGVPEPASWALMVLGFGTAGSALRRRKVAVRFA